MAFNPLTDIDQSFWDIIGSVGADADRLYDALMTMEKDEIVRHCASYKDAQTEFAYKVSGIVSDASEDVLDDLADSIVALGQQRYVQMYYGEAELPPRDSWASLGGLIHVFDSVYYDRFDEEIWDEID
ncbi:hypothetical protein Mal35_20150 [Gimesia maris]|uniref:hypothetical protein n=1 Tax=Gimesia maris TaxID=122 RepID=UPI00118BB862|nr:hypothetical protein [Gimesia maris]QDT78566.1 hypothetical protein Mal35_20150 [Gimesia maris]